MAGAYHHGDLRAAVLRRAAEIIAEDGVGALSLRALANDLGVSHTAPRHHFGSREGVLSALAAEGFHRLEAELESVPHEESVYRLLELGVAYVRFAVEHPAHYALMFDPVARRGDESEVREAAAASLRAFHRQVSVALHARGVDDPAAVASTVAAVWGVVHGLATLAHGGALTTSALIDPFDGDVGALVRGALSWSGLGGRPESHAVRRIRDAGRHAVGGTPDGAIES